MTFLGEREFTGGLSLNEVLGVGLDPMTACPYKKGTSGDRDRHAREEEDLKAQEGTGHVPRAEQWNLQAPEAPEGPPSGPFEEALPRPYLDLGLPASRPKSPLQSLSAPVRMLWNGHPRTLTRQL